MVQKIMLQCFLFRCPLTVRIKINKITYKTKKKYENVTEMPAVIEIHNSHNHSTKSAEALRQLRVLPHVKSTFGTYFDQGKGFT